MSEPSEIAMKAAIEMCGDDADARLLITVAAIIEDPFAEDEL